MTQIIHRRSQARDSKKAFFISISAVASALLIFLSLGQRSSSNVSPKQFIKSSTSSAITDSSKASSRITTGNVDNISYYHCDMVSSIDKGLDLVLLHGARFSKEDWNRSGILADLCSLQEKAIFSSVSAMDLPVSADHKNLQNLIKAMKKANLVKKPVVLVTPSASGKTMTDWMTNGDIHHLSDYVSLWIPVAAGSIENVNEEQMGSIRDIISIFAVYGSRDVMGKRVSERLATLSGATTKELEGGHPVYLDSPKDFVASIMEYISLL